MMRMAMLAVLVVTGLSLSTAPVPAQGVTSENAGAVSDYLMGEGVKALDREEFASALDYFEQAVVAHPRNATAFAYLGRTHDLDGRPEVANRKYTTALAIDPDDRKALQWAGEAAAKTGDMETAKGHLARLRTVCGGRCPEQRSLERAVTEAEAEQTAE